MAKKSGYVKKPTSKVLTIGACFLIVGGLSAGINIYNKLNERPQPSNTTKNTYTTTSNSSSSAVAPNGTTASTTTKGDDIHTVAPPPAISTEGTTNTTGSTSNTTRPTYSSTSIIDPMATTASTNATTSTTSSVNSTTGTTATTSTTSTTASVQTTSGVVQEPSIKDDNDISAEDQLGADFVNALAKLSNLVNNYFQAKNRNVTDTIIVTGINTMEIDTNNTLINIQGEVTVGDNVQNFTAVINNDDIELSMYNLEEGDISEREVLNSLNELLDDEQTEMEKFQYKTYLKTTKPEEVITSVLQQRIDQLLTENTEEAQKEIAHLQTILANTSKAQIDLVYNSRIKTDDGYEYSVSAVINTGKYTVRATCTLPVSIQVKTEVLSQLIEQLIIENNNISINSNKNSSIAEALYIIEDAMNNMDTLTYDNYLSR